MPESRYQRIGIESESLFSVDTETSPEQLADIYTDVLSRFNVEEAAQLQGADSKVSVYFQAADIPADEVKSMRLVLDPTSLQRGAWLTMKERLDRSDTITRSLELWSQVPTGAAGMLLRGTVPDTLLANPVLIRWLDGRHPSSLSVAVVLTQMRNRITIPGLPRRLDATMDYVVATSDGRRAEGAFTDIEVQGGHDEDVRVLAEFTAFLSRQSGLVSQDRAKVNILIDRLNRTESSQDA